MENEKIHKHKKLVTALIIVGLAVSIPLAIVSATYLLTSNHITGTSKPQSTLTLTANNTDVTIGDVLMITAHLNDSKSGITIQFYNGTTALNPTVTTDSNGSAITYYVVSDAYDLYAKATHP